MVLFGPERGEIVEFFTELMKRPISWSEYYMKMSTSQNIAIISALF
jgi:hypothetical protein